MDRRKQAHGTTSVWGEKEPTKSQELDRPLHEKQKEILDKTNRTALFSVLKNHLMLMLRLMLPLKVGPSILCLSLSSSQI